MTAGEGELPLQLALPPGLGAAGILQAEIEQCDSVTVEIATKIL